MVKKIDELINIPKNIDSPESIKIKEEFWKKMHDHLEHTKKMVEDWQEEDRLKKSIINY